MFLVQVIADGDHGGFAAQPGERGSEISQDGSQRQVQPERENEPRSGDPDRVFRFAGLFVPERQVQPDPCENIRQQDDRQHVNPFAEVFPHHQREQVREERDAQKHEDRHDDEIFLGLCVLPFEIVVFKPRQKVGLRGVTVHLGE